MTIADQLRELQTLAPAQLAERYEAVFGMAPRVRNMAWLRRQVAWKLQERALGGLNERAATRLDELMAAIDLPIAAPTSRPKPAAVHAGSKTPMVGTTLVREWHGQTIRVEVREGGFEWNGILYRSLSAVARAITGAAWNGPLFFGLTPRRSAS